MGIISLIKQESLDSVQTDSGRCSDSNEDIKPFFDDVTFDYIVGSRDFQDDANEITAENNIENDPLGIEILPDNDFSQENGDFDPIIISSVASVMNKNQEYSREPNLHEENIHLKAQIAR